MGFELEALGEERLHHDLNRSWRTIRPQAPRDRFRFIFGRRLGLNVESIGVQPGRSAYDLVILKTVRGLHERLEGGIHDADAAIWRKVHVRESETASVFLNRRNLNCNGDWSSSPIRRAMIMSICRQAYYSTIGHANLVSIR